MGQAQVFENLGRAWASLRSVDTAYDMRIYSYNRSSESRRTESSYNHYHYTHFLVRSLGKGLGICNELRGVDPEDISLRYPGAYPELDFGGGIIKNLNLGAISVFLCELFLNTIAFYRKHCRLGVMAPDPPGSAPVAI